MICIIIRGLAYIVLFYLQNQNKITQIEKLNEELIAAEKTKTSVLSSANVSSNN